MGLFDNIRSKTDSTAARLLFGAVVVVFIFSFIGSGFGGQTMTYATVNGSRITDLDLQKRMRMVQRQMKDSALNEDELKSLQEDVLERLVVERAVLDKALDIGVEVSDEEIAILLLSNPGFKDAAGDFSKELYSQAVKQEGYGSTAKYEEQLRKDILYSKLREQVANTVFVSDMEASQIAKSALSSLDIEWVRVNSSSISVEITEAEIATELENNRAEIEATYTADLPFKYQKSERVTFQQITLPFTSDTKAEIETQASGLVEELNNGSDFSAKVVEINPNSFNQGLRTDVTREQLDPTIAEVLFSAENGLIQSITTDNSIQIVKMISQKPAETIPLEQASKEIAQARLERSLKQKALLKKAQEVQSAWENGFDEMQSALYPIQTQSNITMVAPKIEGLGNIPELFTALETVNQTGFLSTPFETMGSVVLVNVTKINTPEATQLAERRKLEALRLKRMRQQSVWAAFEEAARAEASVEENWKRAE